MLPTEPIRPLKDVWLRPRRVFREMARGPSESPTTLLAAAQGVGNFLALYRTEGPERTQRGRKFSRFLRLRHRRRGGKPVRDGAHLSAPGHTRRRQIDEHPGDSRPRLRQRTHGGVAGIWVLTALLAGEATFVETPRGDVEGFLVLLLHVQLCLCPAVDLEHRAAGHGLQRNSGASPPARRFGCGCWTGRRFLVSLFLALAVGALFPGLLLHFIPQR